MQTFLPYASYHKSLECLDNRRLGKQRVEALQILNTLEGRSTGWVNHPAVKMWRGYENSLRVYLTLSIQEWTKRGFKNTIPLPKFDWNATAETPHWFGWQEFHDSHKSNLLRKEHFHYDQFNWNVPHDLPYIWPKGA